MKSLKLVTSALIACAAIFLSFTLTNHEEEIDNSVQEKNLTGSWIMEHSNSKYCRLFIFQDNGLFQTVLTEDYKMTKSELEILLQHSP